MQYLYLYIDDSGKLNNNEDYAIFAGILFKSNQERIEFANKYKTIISEIKAKYSSQEIKGSGLHSDDRRRIMMLSKSFTTFGTVIYNKILTTVDMNDKASRGRFEEYAQRRLIKKVINYLKNKNLINVNAPIRLHICIDEMPTKTNGYYTLKNGLYEELKHGIQNWNYGKKFEPIVYGDLKVDVIYKDSKKNIGIQMADIIANTIRRTFVFNGNWFTSRDYVQDKLKIDVLLRLPN